MNKEMALRECYATIACLSCPTCTVKGMDFREDIVKLLPGLMAPGLGGHSIGCCDDVFVGVQ